MTSLRAFGLALLIVVGCGRETARLAPHAGTAPHRVVASPAPAPPVANLADEDTAGCGLIPKQQFAEATALVREWVHRDSLGEFMSPDHRLFELMACPGHLGGGDEVVVAIDPSIQPGEQRGDSAAFLIVYRRIGRVHSDSTGKRAVFVGDPGVDSIPVNVVRTPFGWRFPFDVANPHLSPAVALRAWQGAWNPASRDSLATLATALTQK